MFKFHEISLKSGEGEVFFSGEDKFEDKFFEEDKFEDKF